MIDCPDFHVPICIKQKRKYTATRMLNFVQQYSEQSTRFQATNQFQDGGTAMMGRSQSMVNLLRSGLNAPFCALRNLRETSFFVLVDIAYNNFLRALLDNK